MGTATMGRQPVMPVAPVRSSVQRQDALLKANMIRTTRSKLKRDLKAGRVAVVPLLLDPPDELLTMKVNDLLLAIPKVGRVKVNKALTRARVSPSKTIGGLSQRQRAELAGALR